MKWAKGPSLVTKLIIAAVLSVAYMAAYHRYVDPNAVEELLANVDFGIVISAEHKAKMSAMNKCKAKDKLLSTASYCSKHPANCDEDLCKVRSLPVCVRAGQDRCAGGSSVVMKRVPLSKATRLRFARVEPTVLSTTTCSNNQLETFCFNAELESNAWTGIFICIYRYINFIEHFHNFYRRWSIMVACCKQSIALLPTNRE